MPNYISVDMERTVPTCKDKSCEQMEHWARVEIGPAILDPVRDVVDCLWETHSTAMIFEFETMAQHRKEEPSCSYCKAIKNAEKMLKAVEGKPL